MDKHRRRFLLSAATLGAATAGGWGLAAWARPRLWNPCHAALPPELAEHPLVRAAWQGIDSTRVWDCHVHIAGTGDSGSGITTAPEMESLLSPVQFAQRLFYLNAGCVHDAPGRVDASYVERMRNLVDGLRPGAKLMLFAFDRCHDEAGLPRPERTAFHVPDAYARDLARRYPDEFEWVCSIHPYRPDAVPALEVAVADGARAVKWLPAAMGMDPASPRCDAFYEALARLDLPLISHAGEEKAVHGAGQQTTTIRSGCAGRSTHGVRVVVAHCASIGQDVDLDRGAAGPTVGQFRSVRPADGRAAIRGAACSATSPPLPSATARRVIKAIVEREAWHGRLLNGSDYPLPGVMPLFSPRELVAAGLLDAEPPCRC